MRPHCSWKTAFEGPNIVLFLHNVTSVRSMLLLSQLAETLKGFTSSPSSENHHCTNSPCSLKAFLSQKQRQWRGTFQMSWRQSYRIATSMLFLDSTGFDSLPSRAHQIALGKLSFASDDKEPNPSPTSSLSASTAPVQMHHGVPLTRLVSWGGFLLMVM